METHGIFLYLGTWNHSSHSPIFTVTVCSCNQGMKSEVLTAEKKSTMVCWDVTLCSLVGSYITNVSKEHTAIGSY
jgi:hypothetical protein